MKILLIAFGGAIGSVLRYCLSTFAQQHTELATRRWAGHALPIGTLAVNLVGCLMIGALSALFARHAVPHEQYRLALTVGVLGGFTTFSAFGLDTFILLERGYWLLAVLNVLASCVGGLLAAWIGFSAIERFSGS